MKNRFKEYHIIDELDHIYKESIIVLDTNSLLNLYRYSDDTRNKYFEILKKVENRLYLTHHVCDEFYKNRLTIIENRSTFKETISELIVDHQQKLLNIITNSSGIDKYNSALSILKHEKDLKDKITSIIEKSIIEIQKSIDEFQQDLDLKYIHDRDPILAEIVDIFQDKISTEILQEDKEDIYNRAEERYKNNIPPGYKDERKGTPDKFGDLIIWNELQNLAKETNKDILFVSDDRKEDWAIKFKGHDLGPRKELIKEFIKNTEKLFYSITTNSFIKLISESHNIQDTENLEKETKIIQNSIAHGEQALINEQLENLSRIQNPFEAFSKQQEALNKMQNPFEAFSKQQEALNKIQNPFEAFSKQQEALNKIQNPFEAFSKQQEALNKMQNPFEAFSKQQEALNKMQNSFEAFSKQQEALNKIQNPFEAFNKQQEALDKTQNPFEKPKTTDKPKSNKGKKKK